VSFQQAVEFVLSEEGGYSNDPQDPGGETNFGISKRAYPGLNIASLTRREAIDIYRRDYWDRLPALPPGIAVAVFDFAVNAGMSRAIKTLQMAVGVNADGVVGPITRSALGQLSDDAVLALFSAERAIFYAGISGFQRYGRGWLRRTFRAHRAGLMVAR